MKKTGKFIIDDYCLPGEHAEPCELLAAAIILRAVVDYREALWRYRKDSRDYAAFRTARECEEFFRSEWFEILSTFPGDELIERIKEYEYGRTTISQPWHLA